MALPTTPASFSKPTNTPLSRINSSLLGRFGNPFMPSPDITDLEAQYFDGVEFMEVEAQKPLLNGSNGGPNGKSSNGSGSPTTGNGSTGHRSIGSGNGNWSNGTEKSARGSRLFRSVQTPIELDDIPPIIRSANNNILWADEQCCRRVGLMSTEARLFYQLLEADGSDIFIYQDYKDMFANFGAEEKRLRELANDLPWWSLDTYHQKPIWLARIQWLERMKGPRLWLLYLMARRRRILKQAVVKLRKALCEKRGLRKLANVNNVANDGKGLSCGGGSNGGNGSNGQSREDVRASGNDLAKASEGKKQEPVRSPATVFEEIQTSETFAITGQITTNTSTTVDDEGHNLERPLSTTCIKIDTPTVANKGSQTWDALLTAAGTKTTVAGALRSSAERIRSNISSDYRKPHSRPSAGYCPIFERGPLATREELKRQVESLMPKAMPYIVIGWFHRWASDPKERILRFEHEEDIFKVMRSGERNVRGYREYFSLKSLKGFALYECDIAKGAHIPFALTSSQQAVLSQFFLAYAASYRHPDDTVAKAWYGWVQKNLNVTREKNANVSKENPMEGKYSVQLIYEWSSYRLTIVFAVPLLLSLIMGFWLMASGRDTITAWTVALYIVTAAAAVIALLAIIGSLKDF